MKAVIYTRVSQDRTAQAKSVTSQEQECRQLCERNGWDVARVYTDNDRSASAYARKSRPQFELLMADLPNYEVLVTWEASRATRDLEVYVALRAACRASGVQWSYSGRLYDLTRTDDAFATGLDMLIAERESSQTRDRVSRVVRQLATAGKPHGRIPYGYTREYDPATGALLRQVPHPTESVVIIEGADRILAGESAYSICRDFEARQLPKLGKDIVWRGPRLVRFLKNPAYAGKRVYRGQVIGEADWPALVPYEKWERLQAILADPSRLTHRGVEPVWLLTGIAKCGLCGAGMLRYRSRGAQTYTCGDYHHVARKIEPVDAYVEGVIKARLMQPDALELLNSGGDDTAGAVAEIRELEARLEGFYSQAADGSLSPIGLARMESAMLGKIEDARARLESSATNRRPVMDPSGLAAEWDTLPVDQRRDWVRSMVTVAIHPAGQGRRTFNPALIEINWR